MAEPTTLDGVTLRRSWPVPGPGANSDKEERGQIVVVGGSVQTPGAVLLAGLAALRVGAGKLTIATTEPTAGPVAVAVPEAGVVGLACTEAGAIAAAAASKAAEAVSGADAVLIGPGMADPAATREFVAGLLREIDDETIVILDALGCSCGVVNDGIGELASRTVITPNRSEAGYLLDDTSDDDDADLAQRIAELYGVTTVLGSCVAVADSRCWRAPKGNAGLGTSGSGDVLAGAVAGMAARTGDPVAAATWGLTLHGAAGDRLAARIGGVGFLARELLGELPRCVEAIAG